MTAHESRLQHSDTFFRCCSGLEPEGASWRTPWRWILEGCIMCECTVFRSLHSIRTKHVIENHIIIDVYIYIFYKFVCVYIYAYIDKYVYVCIYIWLYIYMIIYICDCIYIYRIYIYIYIYIMYILYVYTVHVNLCYTHTLSLSKIVIHLLGTCWVLKHPTVVGMFLELKLCIHGSGTLSLAAVKQIKGGSIMGESSTVYKSPEPSKTHTFMIPWDLWIILFLIPFGDHITLINFCPPLHRDFNIFLLCLWNQTRAQYL